MKLTAGENVTLTPNVGADTLTVAVTTEILQDLIGAMMTDGTGINVTYDDAAGTVTFAYTGLDTEALYDAIHASIVVGTSLTRVVDDAANTITLDVEPEAVRFILASMIQPGTGITVDVDDVANTVTISAPSNLSEEDVQDVIGAMVAASGGTYDDVANTITLPTTSTETIQDVVGALIAAAGGSYDDGAGTITLPSGESGGLEDPTTSNGDLIVSKLPSGNNWATVAQGASATASSNAFGQSPANVLDASDASYWATNNETGGWLKIDLGTPREVTGFYWGENPFGDPNVAFTIASSTDDVSYTSRMAVTTTTKLTLNVLDAPITARYWRIQPTNQATQQYFGFESFEIRGGVVHTIERLPVGTDGQVLTADSGEELGVKWEAQAVGMTDPLTTKGDLIVRNASVTTRLPVGTAGQVPAARTADDEGIVWETLYSSASAGFPAIASAQYIEYEIGFNYQIVASRIVADASGNAVLSVDRATYSAYPTFTNIDGSAPPTLSGAQKSEDTTLTGWTTTGNAGDIIRITVTSYATITRLTHMLRLARV